MKKAIWAGLSSILISTSAMAANATCPVTTSAALKTALQTAISNSGSQFGFGLNMWATVVAADGRVCAVANSSGDAIQGQWLASRVISAQKAFSAATLSLGAGKGNYALSTANLYTPAQPGGTLYGLQFSNPVAPANAYGDKINSAGANVGPTDTALYGTDKDPMVGQVIGGLNVFGGGLGLYASGAIKVGGVGVSGDTSCRDHVVAWNLRRALNYDYLGSTISGPAAAAPTNDTTHPDNIIFDVVFNNNSALTSTANTVGPYTSASGWGHPTCMGIAADVAETWVKTYLPAVR